LLDLHLIWRNCRTYNSLYHVRSFLWSGLSNRQTNSKNTRKRWLRTTCRKLNIWKHMRSNMGTFRGKPSQDFLSVN
jgi:hypothetical protein